MATVKRMVCLANSYKHLGRCIAGKEYKRQQPAGWIRPVSARQGHEVDEQERQYEDGSDPRLLDIIDVPLESAMPEGYQSENWLLDPNRCWTKVGELAWTRLGPFVDSPATLWVNGHKTAPGRNDYVPADVANKLDTSLYLVHLDRVDVSVFVPGAAFNNPRRKVQGNFRYQGVEYGLSITDPVAKQRFLGKGLGKYEIGECYATISLGERHTDDRCYKLIAAIMEGPSA